MSFDINKLPPGKGKLAVITGANTGLGFENTRYFARSGIKVVMACRSEARALDAIFLVADIAEWVARVAP